MRWWYVHWISDTDKAATLRAFVGWSFMAGQPRAPLCRGVINGQTGKGYNLYFSYQLADLGLGFSARVWQCQTQSSLKERLLAVGDWNGANWHSWYVFPLAEYAAKRRHHYQLTFAIGCCRNATRPSIGANCGAVKRVAKDCFGRSPVTWATLHRCKIDFLAGNGNARSGALSQQRWWQRWQRDHGFDWQMLKADLLRARATVELTGCFIGARTGTDDLLMHKALREFDGEALIHCQVPMPSVRGGASSSHASPERRFSNCWDAWSPSVSWVLERQRARP